MEEHYPFMAVNVTVTSSSSALLSARFVITYKWITFGVVCQLIVIFGIGTNIINIICFVKQGFRDQINISLTGMAISDLGSLLTILWTNFCLSPCIHGQDMSFDPEEVQYLTTGIPHTLFTRISAWITALITLERCMCIAMPLKVKHIINSRRVFVAIVCIYIMLTVCQAPVFFVSSLDWKYFPGRNQTLIGLVHTSNRDFVESISYMINNVLLNFLAFIVTIVCTIILTVQLKKHARWRKTSAKSNNISNQNKSVAKMVVGVSVIFIACLIPNCIIFVVWSMFPEYSFTGKNRDVTFIFGGIGVFLESLNSSVNIFVYYRMSTKYREQFQKMFEHCSPLTS